MLGRSPGRTPAVLSNRTAVPVRLLSRASPPPRPSPFEGEGAHRDALGQCASRVGGGGSGWGGRGVDDRPIAWTDAGESSPTGQRFPFGCLLERHPHPDPPPSRERE